MSDTRPVLQPLTLNRRVVFLHIAKTAGTSIIHFFQQRLPADQICSHGDFLSFPKREDLFQAQLKRYQLVSGHFGYEDIAPLLKESYSFTFLRDPVERVLSLYKFCMHVDMQKQFAVARAARDLGLEGFLGSTLPEVNEMLDNQQTWQLARGYWGKDRDVLAGIDGDELLDMAITHLGEFDHVGMTESFESHFATILDDLEIDQPVPSQRQFRTKDPLSRELLSTQALESLHDRLGLDYALLSRIRHQTRSNNLASPSAK